MSGVVEEWAEVVGWRDVLRPWLEKQAAQAVDEALACLLEGRFEEAYKAAVRSKLTQDFIKTVEARMKEER